MKPTDLMRRPLSERRQRLMEAAQKAEAAGVYTCDGCGGQYGELSDCPHCGATKCADCDMGDSVGCALCDAQNGED